MSANLDLVRSIYAEPIRLEPYDPSWPSRYEEERAVLEAAIGEWAVGGVHHIGSTAIPGMEAKPIIDILVGVRDLASSRACFDRITTVGYVYAPYRTEEMHWFCKPGPRRRTHHLHLVPADSSRFRHELAFRNYLRNHPEAAQGYVALKKELAQKFEHDREAYTSGKGDFVRAVLDRALADLGLEG
jgi:GrpB-like predicted nucleotidyltransferase (UPF0157 family)